MLSVGKSGENIVNRALFRFLVVFSGMIGGQLDADFLEAPK